MFSLNFFSDVNSCICDFIFLYFLLCLAIATSYLCCDFTMWLKYKFHPIITFYPFEMEMNFHISLLSVRTGKLLEALNLSCFVWLEPWGRCAWKNCWLLLRLQWMPIHASDKLFRKHLLIYFPFSERGRGQMDWEKEKRSIRGAPVFWGLKSSFPSIFAWRRGSQSELMTRLLCSSAIALADGRSLCLRLV